MDFSKFLSFGKVSLTNNDDTLTSTFYTKAAIHGLDGNDVFQTPDNGGVITSSEFYGGNGDDRLIVNENTGSCSARSSTAATASTRWSSPPTSGSSCRPRGPATRRP